MLTNSLGWIGARLRPDPDHAGWGLLLRAVVERVEIQANPADELLCYVRGRYRSACSLCSLRRMTTVLLIRHGRTSANTAGLLAGRASGIELDAAGVQQAADLGARLSGVQLRAIVTSPLRRCRQTAQAVIAAQSDSCVYAVEQGLVECGYGEWTGRSLRELSKDKLWGAIQQQPSAVRFPGGESMSEMSTRAIAAVRAWNARMEAEHGTDAVWAAVSHGDLIKAIWPTRSACTWTAFSGLWWIRRPSRSSATPQPART